MENSSKKCINMKLLMLMEACWLLVIIFLTENLLRLKNDEKKELINNLAYLNIQKAILCHRDSDINSMYLHVFGFSRKKFK